MTTKHDQLLAAVLETTDDSARLVFADWLEESGDLPRATLIRLQCEAAQLPSWDRRHVEASWQIHALLGAHAARWRAELPALEGIEWTDFERGFVSTVRVRELSALYRHAATIGAASPVHRVELTTLDETPTPWFDGSVPWLRVLRVAGVHDPQVSETSSIVSAAPELEIVDVAEHANLAWLGRRTAEVPVTRLVVKGEHTAGRTFGDVVASAAWTHELAELDMGTSWLDWDSGYFEDPTLREAGARVLADSGRLRGVTRLDIAGQRVGDGGFAAIVAAAPSLRELVARHNELASVEPLRHSGASLVRLDLSENQIGDAGAAIVATSPRLPAVERLELDMCEISGDGVLQLARSPAWSTLRHLDLSRNPIGGDGLRVLAEAPPPNALHTLRLANADLDAHSPPRLRDVAWLGDLLVLDLSANALGQAAAPILEHLAASRVRKLGLRATGIQADTLAAIAPLWPQLVHLDLRGNPLTGVVDALTAIESAIQVLRLGSCQLGDPDLDALARCRLPALRVLVLGDNELTPDGVARLLAAPWAGQLEELVLSHCKLPGAVASRLARAQLPRLRKLDLRGQPLDEAALLALAQAESLRHVPALWFTASTWRFPEASQRIIQGRFGKRWWHSGEDPDEVDDTTDRDNPYAYE